MKRIQSILLIVLLMVSTIGVTVSRHYCESKLVATSFIAPVGDACDADMPMDADSCSDEHDYYSVDSPLLLFALNFDLTPSTEWVEATEFFLVNLYTRDFDTSKIYGDLSPPPSEPNIYTKVQSFLL